MSTTATKTTKTRKAKTWETKNPEQRQEEVKGAHDKIVAAVAAVTSSDDWKRFLDSAARFHAYSFQNVILMHVQAANRGMPALTRVASFGAWAKMGHPVRKGEKGLRIFAPMIVKIKPGEKGYVEGENRTRLVGFKLVSVFDQSQVTDGEKIPADPTLAMFKAGPNGEAPEGLEAALDAQIIAAGYTTSYGDTGSADGYTSPTSRSIVISDRIEAGSAHAICVKAHEIAHMMLHCGIDPDTDAPFAYHSHRGMAETEAEGTAYVVASFFGIDATTMSSGYVANWSGSDPDRIVKAGTRICATARKIIDAAVDHMALNN